MEYQQLTAQQRVEVLKQKLLQLEATHYNLELDAEQAAAVGDVGEAEVHRQSAAKVEARSPHSETSPRGETLRAAARGAGGYLFGPTLARVFLFYCASSCGSALMRGGTTPTFDRAVPCSTLRAMEDVHRAALGEVDIGRV